MGKPADVFDRDREWRSLSDFVAADRVGASLGLVYGRRRQGKTFLLESLVEAHDGLFFSAVQQSGAQNLERLSDAYGAFTRSPARVRFASWEDALRALLALGENAEQPVLVVLDEFPYLLEAAPELPSLLQSLLSPRGAAATGWRTRLILCGSALSTMRGLLAGTAPLRGRASLELLVHPFGYRDAALFWRVAGDPDLALRLHALVGGTAGYLDMCRGAGPTDAEDLDPWVVRTLLDPASAMFREGNVLLAEQDRVTEVSSYFAVLGAISQGHTRRGQMAVAIGKSEGALTHPLTVLTQAGLVTAVHDGCKQKRTTYRVAEPVLRLHQLVVTPNESRLARHQADALWTEVADTISARIYGPHFEDICRSWCAEHASAATLGGRASKTGPTELACRKHGINHEIDVVVTQTQPNEPDRVVALGEAKWRTSAVDSGQLARLEHLRELLGLGSETTLLLFSRHGFTPGLTTAAERRRDVQLVDLTRLYSGD